VDISKVIDRGESPIKMEPLLISQGSKHRSALTDLAVELAGRSSGFRRSLPAGILAALSTLVRAMNCYYSNLIEGHNTHPIDIERSLQDDYSTDLKKRNLQLEAKAHVSVQQWIDDGGLLGRAATQAGICEIHQRFSDLLPEELLIVKSSNMDKRTKVISGQLRQQDVKVGQHIAISPGALPQFMAKFEQVYSNLGKAEMVIASAAAHHRLLWIHPFLDGNGRVARLMSYAMLVESLDTGGIWSIARGLARNESAYKGHLAECDLPRRNDLDGRGNLSEEGLVSFSTFFLETCLDQIKFMEELVQPNRLRQRILMWAEEEVRTGILPAKVGNILEAILYRGELPRSEISAILDVSDRQARRVVATLVERGVIISDSTRSPLQLSFPAVLAARWLPGLFPEKV
jgi:Fic family protein